MLKKVVTVVQVLTLFAAAIFVVLLFANEPDDDGGTASGGNSEGAAIFADNCAVCHGANGEGLRGPPLQGIEERMPDKAVQISFVERGGGGMPSFADRLSAEEIEAVVDYTREDL